MGGGIFPFFASNNTLGWILLLAKIKLPKRAIKIIAKKENKMSTLKENLLERISKNKIKTMAKIIKNQERDFKKNKKSFKSKSW